MSTTYKIINGDTFDSISRKSYGTEVEADRIARANPGVSEPLTSGVSLSIPDLPGAPQNVQQQTVASQKDEVAILIDGNRFRFWNRVRITKSIDTMDTIEFGAPFEIDNFAFRKIFKPFSFKTVDITVGGTLFFTGTMVTPSPVLENNQRIVSVSAYSLPGVLNDCTPPASAFPLEFDGQGLQEIAITLAAPFGINVKFRDNQGAIFDRVASDPTKKILSFLIDLARQRNLIISSTSSGTLLFWKSIEPGQPVARLQQGSSPVLAITPTFKSQGYYSHITGVETVSPGITGSQYTVKNSRSEGVIRPFTFKVKDAQNADVKTVVQAKMGRMFGSTVSYSVFVDTWRDPNGNRWQPNTTITLLAPGAMIYNEYEFLIRSVEFDRDEVSQTAVLNVVLPGSFSGVIPEALPWDD